MFLCTLALWLGVRTFASHGVRDPARARARRGAARARVRALDGRVGRDRARGGRRWRELAVVIALAGGRAGRVVRPPARGVREPVRVQPAERRRSRSSSGGRCGSTSTRAAGGDHAAVPAALREPRAADDVHGALGRLLRDLGVDEPGDAAATRARAAVARRDRADAARSRRRGSRCSSPRAQPAAARRRAAPGARDRGLPVLHGRHPSPDGDVLKATYMLTTAAGWALGFGSASTGRWRAGRCGACSTGRAYARVYGSPAATLSRAVTAVLFTCAGQRVDIVTAFGRAGATTLAVDAASSRRRCTTPTAARSSRASTTPATSRRCARSSQLHDVRLDRPARRPRPPACSREARDRLGALVLLPGAGDDPALRATSTSRTASSRSAGSPTPPTWLPGELPADAAVPGARRRRGAASARGTSTAPTTRASSTSSSATRPPTRWCRRVCRGRGVLDRRLLRPRRRAA